MLALRGCTNVVQDDCSIVITIAILHSTYVRTLGSLKDKRFDSTLLT
jgi:hypothetical protein